MTQVTLQARRIMKQEGICGGVPLLEGTRVRISDIAVEYDFRGLRPEEIAEEFSISVADVFAALTYYYEHLEEIRKEIEERKTFFERLKH